VTKQDVLKTPHLARWFTSLASHSHSLAVWGSFKWCSKKVDPVFAEQKADKGHKKSVEAKDHKKSKEQTQAKGEKGQKGKDNSKKDQPKPEKKEKEEGKESNDERIERELKEHNDKVKAWLDVEIKFDFEEFKRVYCNAQEGEWPGVFEWLWKH